ncbi:polysaccharide biosynthesis/export family protein [Methylosinus sporium]|nr:polysaccharide biosynthesis/export family protein [Methylosinus sporium]
MCRVKVLMTRQSFFLLLAMALILTGCDIVPLPGPSVGNEARLANLAGTPRLQPGDKIKITVFGEDKLSGEYDIDPGGFVSLPLAGTIQAGGLTKSELELSLAKKFRGEYLRDPKVTVDIATFRPFYVLGEVEKPGEYPYKSGLNVVSAIAVAGGSTYRASQSRILIQRASGRDFQEYPLTPTIPIHPGDLVRVPERYF